MAKLLVVGPKVGGVVLGGLALLVSRRAYRDHRLFPGSCLFLGLLLALFSTLVVVDKIAVLAQALAVVGPGARVFAEPGLLDTSYTVVAARAHFLAVDVTRHFANLANFLRKPNFLLVQGVVRPLQLIGRLLGDYECWPADWHVLN